MDEKQRKEAAKWARDLIISVVIVPAILVYFQMSPLVVIAGGVISLALLTTWERGYLTAATWLPDGTIGHGRLRAGFGAILFCGLIASGYVASHRQKAPVQLPRPPEAQPPAPDAAPLPPSPSVPHEDFKTTGAWLIYRCEHQEKTPAELQKDTAAYKKEMDILGDMFDFSTTIVPVVGGIEIYVWPKTAAMQQSTESITKYSIQVRYLTERTIVVYTPEIEPAALASNFLLRFSLAMMVTPDSILDKQVRGLMNRLPGVKVDTCKLY
jgi:hypothetical protein